MLPALNKARAKAQSIYCVNQLKQIFYAAQLYADDHKQERVPCNLNGKREELAGFQADDYGMNEYLTGYTTADTKQRHMPNEKLRYPDRTVYFGERADTTMSVANDWDDLLNTRHKTQASFVYLSGTVRTLQRNQIPFSGGT